jgi:bacillithiol system protein YtxJ
MTMAAAPRTTLPERFFQLADPAAVDRFLDGFEWCAVFKAATSERTFEAWFLVQHALEPRPDVAVGLIQIPAGRPASNHVAARAGVSHRSPQLLLFHGGASLAHLDEKEIQPEALAGLLAAHLPAAVGQRVVNPHIVSLERYRRLLVDFVAGTMGEERFQWAYLDRLRSDAAWRDEESFALLASLFDGEWDRAFTPARIVAHEFQGQTAGRLEPLKARAARLLGRLPAAADSV